MTGATNKQIMALKRFAKNPELSRGLLKGVQFDQLSKEEASELIQKCYDHQNGAAEENIDSNDDSDETEFKVSFSQNYKNGNGSFSTVTLTEEELAEIREAHKQHCVEVLSECEEDYPDDRELQLAMFDKRADKVFTWLQQALDEKVRKNRE